MRALTKYYSYFRNYNQPQVRTCYFRDSDWSTHKVRSINSQKTKDPLKEGNLKWWINFGRPFEMTQILNDFPILHITWGRPNESLMRRRKKIDNLCWRNVDRRKEVLIHLPKKCIINGHPKTLSYSKDIVKIVFYFIV